MFLLKTSAPRSTKSTFERLHYTICHDRHLSVPDSWVGVWVGLHLQRASMYCKHDLLPSICISCIYPQLSILTTLSTRWRPCVFGFQRLTATRPVTFELLEVFYLNGIPLSALLVYNHQLTVLAFLYCSLRSSSILGAGTDDWI